MITRGDLVVAVCAATGITILGLELAWHRANRRLGRDLARLRALGRDAVPAPRAAPDDHMAADPRPR